MWGLFISGIIAMITAQHISKTFAGKPVVCDVSGTFEAGRTNLLIGASGTGKSVFVKCMVGLLAPDTGDVFYHQRNFTHGSSDNRRQIRREIGMLFQGIALFDSKNVEDNVRFPLDILSKMTSKEKRKRVSFCLDRVGLDDTHKKMPSELSGGMKKRVGIARAIVNSPKYLFCDEPNSGLDPLTAIKIDRLIQEITHEYKITTLVVTHDMNSVMEIGEQVIFMHQGKACWTGTAQTILDTKQPELNAFIMSNKLVHALKSKSIK